MKQAALLAWLFVIAMQTAVAQSVNGPMHSKGPESAFGCRNVPNAVEQKPTVDFSGKLPISDYLEMLTACNARFAPGRTEQSAAPASAWLEAERRLYQKVLSAQRVDVLIVPLQVQGFGLDRIERALMTADLAYSIGETGQYRVADPFLTARALGEGLRRVDPNDIYTLAEKVGATRVVSGYVGHDGHHAFTLTLQVKDRTPPGGRSMWQRDWRQIAFTDEQTPALVFHRMLPELLGQLPLDLKAAPRKGSATVASKIALSPRELPSSTNPPTSAAALNLLGALSAPSPELSRERLFERALLSTLRDAKQANPFLHAYSLMNLDRRPSALAAIASQHSPQADTLRALLDGNLPGAKQSISQVSDSLELLLLQIPLRDLEASYGRKMQTRAAATAGVFGAARTEWEPFVELRVRSPDPWSVDEPMVIKALLDRTLPAPGLDTNTLVRGNEAARAAPIDDVDVDIAIARHVRRAAESIPLSTCCGPESQRATQWDLLWLLEGLAEARIMKSLDRTTRQQGLPKSTIERLARYEPLFSGHPLLELARADATLEMARSSPADVSATWHAQHDRAAAIAARWAPGQNAIAADALLSMGVPSEQSSFMVDAYGYDYPRQPYWFQWFIGAFGASAAEQRKSFALEALAFSTWSVQPLLELEPGDQPGQAGAVMRTLGQRFMGNPNRPLAPSKGASSQAAPVDRVAQLKATIQADPELWSSYVELADLTLRSGGSYADASRIFLSYPGFRERDPQDAVALSNRAYEAGSRLYWLGMTDLAKPLYQIAAGLQTGSEASMTSELRLQILAGDYAGATAGSFERALRYESPYAYRDFLGFLHALGEREQAWDAFSQLNSAFDNPQVWLAALVGHDREGLTSRQIRDWLAKPEIRSAHFGVQRFAPYYAVLWSSTEHTILPDLGRLVVELEGPRPATSIRIGAVF